MVPIRDDVPSLSRPVVMYLLIITNILVFMWEVALGPEGLRQAVASFGVVPAQFAEGVSPADPLGPYPSLITALFLHGGWLHLIVNMWYLWIFGDNVEDRMGHGRFLAFYLLGGMAANLAHIALNVGSPVPSIGASGAIATVLGGYLVLFPGARVITIVPLLFIFAVQLPAAVVLGVWFLLQLLSGLGSVGAVSGGIAYWAHIGGFVFGLATIRLFAPRRHFRRGRGGWESWRAAR